MKQAYSLLLIFWLAVRYTITTDLRFLPIIMMLGVLCLYIIKDRFYNNTFSNILFTLIIIGFSFSEPLFIILLGIPLLEFSYQSNVLFSAFVCITGFVLLINRNYIPDLFILVSAGFLGYVLGIKEKREQTHVTLLDNERMARYALEKTQLELIKAKNEIEHLTEVRERNRIASDLHDHIGHRIAGVLLNLRGVSRILASDPPHAQTVLNKCSEKLSETLELTRETVYNIQSHERVGLESFKAVFENFTFCPVQFEYHGDFNRLKTKQIQVLTSVLTEALTNIAKHSHATLITLQLHILKAHVRLLIQDNGPGSAFVKEHVGISGMRERIENASGTFSIDSKNGFLIVCTLPIHQEGSEE